VNAEQLLEDLALGEDYEIEFKSARGGVPRSLWESYSAFANTDGGIIVLGVKQHSGTRFEVQGLEDAAKIRQDFWNNVNNRSHVSHNLLGNDGVRVVEVNGDKVLVIEIPRADRYRWSERLRLRSSQLPSGTSDTATDTASDTPDTTTDTPDTATDTSPDTDPKLLEIARPAREQPNLAAPRLQTIILELCQGRFLTPRQLGVLLGRNFEGLQRRHLGPLVQEGKLSLRYSEDRTHPDQAYKSNHRLETQ